MSTLPEVIFFIYGGLAAVCLVILVFLIIRRIRIRKKENFENRDN